MTTIRLASAILLVAVLADARGASAQVLDKQKQLDAQTFWDNRDWDWYAEQIPFFECPDAEITTTYYYVTFREDDSRLRDRHAAENLAWLKRFAISMLKQQTDKESIAMRRRLAGWNPEYLAQVLGLSRI